MKLLNTFSRGRFAATSLVFTVIVTTGATIVKSAVGDPGDPAPNAWSDWKSVSGSQEMKYRYRPSGFHSVDSAAVEFQGVGKSVDVTIHSTYHEKDGSDHYPVHLDVRHLVMRNGNKSDAVSWMPCVRDVELGDTTPK